MNFHLISFGSPHSRFLHTRGRFLSQATKFNAFKSINIFSDLDCFDFSKELLSHRLFMESTRAYGFWIWKSFLVSELMSRLPEDDVICYADLGCTFNINGKDRLNEYYSIVMEKGSLCFDIFHLEKEYTKSDTYLRVFPQDNTHNNTGQRCSTTFLLKNNSLNRDIMNEFKSISIEGNYHFIDNSESMAPNDKEYKGEHRYDQSIFSLLSKKYNLHCIPDETYWHPNWNLDGVNYPIWATRIK